MLVNVNDGIMNIIENKFQVKLKITIFFGIKYGAETYKGGKKTYQDGNAIFKVVKNLWGPL